MPKTAWVAEVLLILMPTKSDSKREQKQPKQQAWMRVGRVLE